jgi:hypothetical protein
LAEAAIEDPDQLTEYENGNKYRLAILTTLLEEALSYFALLGIVIAEIPDKDVGIDAPHVPE